MKITPRILLVNNESESFQIFSIFLSRIGFKVTHCHVREEIMNILAGGRFDIMIVADQKGDPIADLDFLGWIKAHRPHMKILVVPESGGIFQPENGWWEDKKYFFGKP